MLNALLLGLDLAALERTQGGGFSLVATPPPWFQEFFPGTRAGSPVALTERFPFLENFAIDAEHVWNSSSGPASLRSGFWLEPRQDGRESLLEAVAVNTGDRAVLLVGVSSLERSALQHVIQRGREQSLELRDERRSTAALRRERASLEDKVAHRSAELANAVVQLQQEEAQRRRAETHARFLALGVDSSAELICAAGPDLVLTYANRAFADRFGFALDRLDECRVSELAEDAEAGAALAAEARKGRWRGDLRCRTASGEVFPAAVSCSPVLDEGGAVAGFILVLRDLSEQVRARRALAQVEEQLRHAVKMEAVGHLAGGIAHDFNNLLTAILGYCTLVLDELPQGMPAREDVERIHREADRAAALTRQLLMFSRRQAVEPTLLDLRDITSRISDLLRRVIGESVHLVTRTDPDLWPVLADAGQLEQLIVNLAVNGRDAMPHGGTLTVVAGNRRIAEARETASGSLAPGEYVVLEVRDTGTGIDPVLLGRIFEPFFTTKLGTKGTGLGLSVVYGIVQRHGGHIEVTSVPAAGSAFTVYLPRAVGEPERRSARAGSAPRQGGHETILLVEDEETVRHLLVSLLTGRGYTVLAAATPEQARTLSASHAGRIDLLVTDVILPSGNGRQVAEALVAVRPDTAVLFISGYTDDVVLPHGVVSNEAGYLQKPFLPAAFLERVRQCLDDRR